MWSLSSWEMLRGGCSGLGVWGQGLHRKLRHATQRGRGHWGRQGRGEERPQGCPGEEYYPRAERRRVDEQYLMTPFSTRPSQMLRPPEPRPLTHSLTCLHLTGTVWGKQMCRCPGYSAETSWEGTRLCEHNENHWVNCVYVTISQ